MSDYNYDVAFSFAGAQRPYVEQVYQSLSSRGYRVFYDGGEAASLWGRDLYQHLSDIYAAKAKYCVVFLSKEYAEQLWTRHELKAAQARAFRESEEYLLPARFDDTSIPGLLPTIAYQDLRRLAPEAFANIIERKLSAQLRSEPNKRLEPSLEVSLADAVIYADGYLQPQALDLADAIASAVRSSFAKLALKIDRNALLPYLRSESGSHRVTGYIAYQVSPQEGMALDFVSCLRRERTEALDKRSTKPLWQLLVCIGKLMDVGTSNADAIVIMKALGEHFDWLSTQPTVDPGGQCKRRIERLLARRASRE